MKQSKAAPTVSEIENTGIQEAEKKPQDSKQVFKLDPNAPTSVINGNFCFILVKIITI